MIPAGVCASGHVDLCRQIENSGGGDIISWYGYVGAETIGTVRTLGLYSVLI